MEELDIIVQRMIDAGESEEAIRMVIQEYNKKGKPTGVAEQDATVTPQPEIASESMGLEQGNGSLDLEKIDLDTYLTLDPQVKMNVPYEVRTRLNKERKQRDIQLKKDIASSTEEAKLFKQMTDEYFSNPSLYENVQDKGFFGKLLTKINFPNVPWGQDIYAEDIKAKGRLEGTVSELNKNPEYREEIIEGLKNRFEQQYPDTELPDVLAIDNFVDNAINKKINEERNIITTKRQEAREQDEEVVDVFKEGADIYIAKSIVSEKEAPAINIANEIIELEEQRANNLEKDPVLDAKIKAKQKEQEDILKQIDEDYTSFFDISTGERLTATEKQAREDAGETETMTDKSKELTALERFYSSQPREKLKTQYYGNISDIKNLEQEYKDIWNIVSADPENTAVYEKVKNTDFFKNLSNREKAREALNYMSDEQRDRAKKELGFIDEDMSTSLLEAEALKTTLLLNRDPASVKQDFGDVLARGAETMMSAYFDESDLALDFGTSKRKELDVLEKTLNDAGIEVSKEQKENFERGATMELFEATTGLAAELPKFALANKAAGLAGITARMNTLLKSKKLGQKALGYLLGTGLEEAKFQAVTGGEAETGAGAFFFLGGAAANKLMPFRFGGKAAALNPALEKLALPGVGGAVASETALFGEGLLKAAEGNVDFDLYMNEHFGEDAKVMRRFAINAANFALIGLGKMKFDTDFKSMAGKYELLDKLKNDMAAGNLTGSQKQQKQNSIDALTRDIAISERSYDNLVMSDQLENKANAEKALAEGNLNFIEKRQAKKAISRANANIERIRRKVNTFKTNVEKSGILVGNKKLKVIVTENGKDAQGRDLIASDSKAEYIAEKDGIPMNAIVVNMSKMRPGVQGHELGHAYFKAAFNANPKAAEALKNKIETQVEPVLDPFFKEATGSTFKEFLNKTYEKELTAEEYIFNVVEQLSKPKFKNALLEQGVLLGLKRAINNTANSMGLGFKEKDLRTAGDVLEFLSSIEDVAKRGGATALKKKFDQFRDVKVDGNKLFDIEGVEITPERVEEARASKELETSASKLAEKYQNNKEGMSPKELTDFKDQYVRLGIEAVSTWAAKKGVPVSAIKGSPEALDNIKGKILDQFESVIRNYKPVNPRTGEKVELSTYMQKPLGLRVGPKIVEEYSRKLETTSTDTEFAKQLVDQTTPEALAERKAKEEAEAKDLIDVRDFTPVKMKRELIEESVKLRPETVSTLTYKTAANEYSPKVAEALLNMPYERATGKSTLNYGKEGAAEVSRMQGLFRNVQEFKKFMEVVPEYNVAGPESTLKTLEGQEKIIDVSPEAKGYAIGLNNKLMGIMYDKVNVKIPGISSPSGRGLGKTSQPQVWRLKPEFRKPSVETLRKLQQDMGITPAGELSIPMKGANRTKFGTLLQGLTKVYIDNVTNKVIRSKIEESGIKTAKGTEQIIADIAAGTSKRMASKEIETKVNKFKPSFLKNEKDIKMYEEGESDFYNAIASGMKVEKAFNISFDKNFLTGKNGKPLKSKNDLIKSIEWITGEYNEAVKNLSKDVKPEPVQRFLYEQVSEQRANENLKSMLGLDSRSLDFDSPEQIYSVVDKYKSVYEKAGKKSEQDLIDLAAFTIKHMVSNAKTGSGLNKWVKTDAGWVLETTGKGGGKRQGLFGTPEEFVGVLVEPYLKNPESLKIIRTGSTKKFQYLEYNGERLSVDRAPQSADATAKAIKEIKDTGEISNETLEKSLEYANKNKDLFLDFLDAVKEGSKNDIGMFLSNSTATMENFLRAAANLNSFALQEGNFNPKEYRYEHNPPANVMKVYAVDYINGKISRSEFRKILDKYNASIIPEAMDNIVNEKYQSSIPLGGIENTWKRYYNLSHYGRNMSELTLYERQANGTYVKTKKGVGFEQAYKDAQSAIKSNTSSKASKEFFEKPRSVAESLENLDTLDKALNVARNPKSPVKKIRVFDFDDTLAKSNSKVNYTVPNIEGGFSEGANKYKAIFMVGGPGAGKTNIGKGLQLGRRGFKVVNQDIALEAMKEEVGLPAKESEYTAEQRSMRSKLGASARKAAVEKFDKYAKNGDGMVIDGTGASYNATMKKVKQLEDAGFEVHMVVANTPLETAIARNQARVERSLPDFVVRKTWEQVQESAKRYREEFGDRLYEIETTDIGLGEVLPERFLQKVYSGITRNKVGKVDATSFASEYDFLESQGAKFDFREFKKVIDGERGPLFSVAEKIAAARGTEDVFILTARPPESAVEIQKFMKKSGIDIPLKNITGLGDGTAKAKAKWILGKAGEGYNDFYFADDAVKNVEAVKQVLSQIDVKSKVQQAIRASKDIDLSKTFNQYLEAKTGIGAEKKYARVKGEVAGKGKGRFNFFVPYSANDFTGLLYTTLAKGKTGEAQMQFYKENILDPYAKAMSNISRDRVALMNDYSALKKQLSLVPKTLRKKLPGEPFTQEQAVRVNVWTKQGMEVPGLSKADLKTLNEFVEKSPELSAFSEQIVNILKGDQYAKPGKNWVTGSITTDMLQTLNTTKRAKYLELWKQNVNEIFSEQNLNKLEASFGPKYRQTLEKTLRRMETGRNRTFGSDTFAGRATDWLTGSIGVTMFFNARSAVLQTISAVNYLNFKDNNIFAATRAFANQKQYWKDWKMLMNSDFLVERRSGLKMNVNEADIANMAKEGGVRGVINKLLQFGFTPTQIADSLAIATGGATYYRNRVRKYVKEGMNEVAAEKKALQDWREISEENQQSSRPDRISEQQASALGRVVLAFANTPMQYNRIMKKAFMDLKDGRGSKKENISKILYYGAIQNIIFNALQQGLFALAFDDEEDEDKEKQRYVKVANGMADSILRGSGYIGAIASVLKNTAIKLDSELEKKQPKLDAVLVNELLKISPPLSAKVSRIRQAARSAMWDKKEMKEKGFSLDNPAYLAAAQVISATTNAPLDQVIKKVSDIDAALFEDMEEWQRISLVAGWDKWDIGLKEKKKSTSSNIKLRSRIRTTRNKKRILR